MLLHVQIKRDSADVDICGYMCIRLGLCGNEENMPASVNVCARERVSVCVPLERKIKDR